MQLIATDIFHAEPIWWTIEMTAELRDRINVGLLRRARQIADRHVLDHAPAKRAHRSHRKLLSREEGCEEPHPLRQETSRSAALPSRRCHYYRAAGSFNPHTSIGA